MENLKFDQNGLIPAIVVDNDSGKVLTLAYMNEESLRISMEKRLMPVLRGKWKMPLLSMNWPSGFVN